MNLLKPFLLLAILDYVNISCLPHIVPKGIQKNRGIKTVQFFCVML